MKQLIRRRRTAVAVSIALVSSLAGSALAFQVRPSSSRFGALVVDDAAKAVELTTLPLASLPGSDGARVKWEQFRVAHGSLWSIYLDRRSGVPLLVEGPGLPLAVGNEPTLSSVEKAVRDFAAANRALLMADDLELVLNRTGSGELMPGVWQLSFDRVVSGVPVSDERYLFTVSHGKLISFGSPRWSRIAASPVPGVGPEEAFARAASHMKLSSVEAATAFGKSTLEFVPLVAGSAGSYSGAVGGGYESALVWRTIASVPGDIGTWETVVDAKTGAIRSFQDVNDYAHVQGGVYPVTNDQICPDGCEVPNLPMPYARVYIGDTIQTMTTPIGEFDCTPGGDLAETILGGRFFQIGDNCGHLVEGTFCDNDVDLRTGTGTDCATPAGDSVGNTHGFRSSFYHLNRVAEHARSWLPSVLWASGLLEVNINRDDDTCTAFFEIRGGTLNFFRSGVGCADTAELAGVTMHEWAHGFDRNDGGGTDSPNEAYADISSFMMTQTSCQARGSIAANCLGYGDHCLSCTGVRELDWDKRQRHTPATPANFVTSCSAGSGVPRGPCGKESHCEGIVSGEAMWDLATRDLPASGLDQATSWQIADRLWWTSRLGSGGSAYACTLPDSNGCIATSWFEKLRTADDDDGNLANGTPHAAAIFAAFDRHKIACGTVADASNQSTANCPALGASTLTAVLSSETAVLSWTPVANANIYRIRRNEIGCGSGSNIIATVVGTLLAETGLANGLTEYYTVQAVGVNPACEGLVSNCVVATPQPFAGSVKLDAPSYGCTGTIGVTVTDSNIGIATTTVKLTSPTEPLGETITVTQIAPGSDKYTGTIALTSAAPSANGVLSVVNGDTITATYIDASDGGGGLNVPRVTSSVADCVVPVITKVQATNITGTTARVTWTTNELASSVTHHGLTPPPGTTTSVTAPVLGHGVDVLGLAECTPYVYSVESNDIVGNVATDNASGSYYAFTTGKSTQISYPSTDTPLPIPDLNPGGVTSTVQVADSRTVQDVNVTVNVQHTFDEDLTFTLTTPRGQAITLASAHGGHDDDYTGTVFDDQAADPLGNAAPFTGAFRPDSPLALADGIDSAGAWKLTAVDHNGQDVGTILNWTLQLTFATPTCGAHAGFRSQARVVDSCVTGGAGNGNTYWDAGEDVRFKVNIANDGTVPLTGVTATVTSSTPGVVLTDGTASFPDIPAAGSADSAAPHFTVSLPTSLACGGNVSFQVSITTNQGSWSGAFSQFVGRATNGTGRVLDERFGSGIPATWAVVDGGTGGGAASQWTAGNPGVRPIAYPMLLPVVTVDSDAAGPGATQDEQLISPVMNLSTATTATLQFDQFFRWFAGGLDEIADVDVRSSSTGGAWVNVLRQQGAGSANPDHRTINISTQAAGAADAQVRFRDYNGSNEQYWQLDNVTVDTSAPGSCDMPLCSLPIPSGAKPVADGVTGQPMRGSRANATGSSINLTWDVATCSSADHHVLYGNLGSVATLTVTGASCNLGTTGSATWAGVPAGNLWFVVVGDDNATVEGSWGTDGGGQRGGTTASGLCGTTSRNNSGVCP